MLRRSSSISLLALGVAGVMTPLAHAGPQGSASIETEVARLEEVYSQSFVSGDTRIAERLVAQDFVGFEPNGKTSDKAAILADVRNDPRPTSLKIPALTVKVHGDTALALGTEVDLMPGNKTVGRRWLDTWRKTPDGWRLVGSAEMTSPP